MDAQHLQQALQLLESAGHPSEARTQFSRADKTPHVMLVANQAGLVSLAVTLLRAALSPASEGTESSLSPFDHELDQIQLSQHDLLLGWVEHSNLVPIPEEIFAQRRRQSLVRDRVALIGCSLVGFILMMLLITGLFTWIGMVLGNPHWSP